MTIISLCRNRRTPALAAAAAMACALGARAAAQVAPSPDRPAFGLVGIARGQSVRVSVSVDNPDLRPGEVPAGPCHVTIGFVNENNQPITNRRGGMTTAAGTVNPGGSLALEIESNQVFTAADGARKLLRPVVGSISNPDLLPAGPCRGLAATLELLDSAAGATSVFYAPTTGFTTSPSPDRPGFGLVGVARGQGAELHVFIDNPDLRTGDVATDTAVATDGAACQVSLAFVDETGARLFDRRGRMIGASGVMTPGESLTLNLAPSDLFRPGAPRHRGSAPSSPANQCRVLRSYRPARVEDSCRRSRSSTARVRRQSCTHQGHSKRGGASLFQRSST